MVNFVRCAKNANPALLEDQEEPFDWEDQFDGVDVWPPTMAGRCALYATGALITLDPARENNPRDQSTDEEQIAAILAADGQA